MSDIENFAAKWPSIMLENATKCKELPETECCNI